jgi:CBS domain-containing membrane protein
VRTTTIVDIDKLYEKTCAERIMTRNPFTVPPDTQVVEVMEIFSKEMFHAVPVLDKGKLVGIVSHHDVMYYIA